MTHFFDIDVVTILFAAMAADALIGLGYGWNRWRRQPGTREMPAWRRAMTNVAFLAVSAQVILFAAFWTPVGYSTTSIGRWARWVLLLFAFAVPSILAGKGATRWLLLSLSVLVFVFCFFIALGA